MTIRQVLDRRFSELLQAPIGRLGPNEIEVARSALREESEAFAEGVECRAPLWILVTHGRGVVSVSRFLYRIAVAWAEDMASPEYLLRRDFLEDLRAGAARALDAVVLPVHARVFAPRGEAAPDAAPRFFSASQHERAEIEGVLARPPSDAFPVLLVAPADHENARLVASKGYEEYGRMVRFEVEA